MAAKKLIHEVANQCPLRYLNSIFGGKWKMPILCILSCDDEPKRYSVIKRRLHDVTNVMLSQSLHELEAAGLIHREQYNEVPPRVEYTLTERGRTALPFLNQAAAWALNEMKLSDLNPKCGECAEIK